MKRILLFGGGNQVHYTIDIIEKENKYEVVGIIDSVHEIGTERYGYKVLGRQGDLKSIVEDPVRYQKIYEPKVKFSAVKILLVNLALALSKFLTKVYLG
jgi:FlaA1/EpsC-like NDP-sugar epimerase